MSDYDLVIAGSFALQKTRGSVSNSAEDLGNTVRDMSLAIPLDSMVRYLVPVDHTDEAICAAALKFIAQPSTKHMLTSQTLTRTRVLRPALATLLQNTSDSVISWVLPPQS